MQKSDVALSLHKLGQSFELINDYEKALDYYKQAYHIRIQFESNLNSNDVLNSLEAIGNCYDKMGEFEKGLTYKKKAFDINKKSYLDRNGNLDFNEFIKSKTIETNLKIRKLEADLNKDSEIFNEKENKFNDTQFQEDHQISVSNLYNEKGEQFFKLGDYKKALNSYQSSLKFRGRVDSTSNNYRANLAEIKYSIGLAQYKLNNFDEALNHFEDSLRIFNDISEFQNPNKAKCLNSIGLCYEQFGDYHKAYKFKKDAYEMRKELYSDEHGHLDLADSLNDLGNCLDNFYKYDEALELKNKAYKMRVAIHQTDKHLDIVSSLNSIGYTFEKMGNLQLAFENLNKAYLIRKDLIESDSDLQGQLEISNSLHNLGVILERLGNLNEARNYLTRALELRKKIYFDENHIDVANTLNSLSVCFFKLSNADKTRMKEYGNKSIEYSKMSLKIKRLLNKNDIYQIDIADSLYNLGVIYENLGENRLSEQYYNECLLVKKKIYKNDSYSLIDDLLKRLKLKAPKGSNINYETENSKNNKIIENWTYDQIINWFDQNNVNKNLVDSLILQHKKFLDGKLLKQFYEMCLNTPRSFSQTLLNTDESQIKVTQDDLDHFKNCLIQLFDDEKNVGKDNNPKSKVKFII